MVKPEELHQLAADFQRRTQERGLKVYEVLTGKSVRGTLSKKNSRKRFESYKFLIVSLVFCVFFQRRTQERGLKDLLSASLSMASMSTFKEELKKEV